MLRKYVCVRQNDQSDCGAAALASVALQYRRPIGLQQLRELSGTDRSGTNLSGLLQAAEELGFSARAVKACYNDLRQVPVPAIAHINIEQGLGHFIVIHGVQKQRVVIADPARGILHLSKDQFIRCWTGHLLLIVPQYRTAPLAVGQRSVSPFYRLLKLLCCHTSVVVEAFFCALLMTALGVASSYFIQHLVDSVLARNEKQLLNALGLGMVFIVLFRSILGALRQYLVAHIGQKVELTLMAAYTRHTLQLPLGFFDMRAAGDVLSRVNDASKVRDVVSGTALTAIVDGTLVIFFVAVLWLYDARLAAVSTFFIPLMLVSVALHHPGLRRRSRNGMEHASRFFAHLVEDITGVETVKAFGAERQRGDEAESRLVAWTESMFSLQKFGTSMNTIGMFVTSIAGITILWYGSHQVMNGGLTIGRLMFFYTLVGSLFGPLERLASVNLQIQDGLAAVDRLYQIMELQLEQRGAAKKATFRQLKYAIELREVSFRYGCRANVLEKVSLHIPAGKTVAVVGGSGSGKSTLLRLLMGFYAPTEGAILIDGVDMRDLAAGSLRSRIGFVSQDAFVFSGTLRDNIALGLPESRLEQVMAAAEAAGLEDFISRLPNRYDTIIGERGANLSGGQRQRLAIARAILRKPDILIFDEATSHLDLATEWIIRENLTTNLAGKTVVLVAHRLSTIKDVDLIYVLNDGQILEQGTHSQLIAGDGWYADLCRLQTDDKNGSTPLRTSMVFTPTNGEASIHGVSHA